jgi:hypothetical protein
MKSISCGDWHLGWGYGGNDKVGKLSTEDGETFRWEGRSQGRHGGKWNLGANCTFTIDENGLNVTQQEGSIPRSSELYNGANRLIEKL